MPEQIEAANRAGHVEQEAWPGLTLEAVLYAALIVGAAFIRFYDLGRWPLMPEEARQALAAWRFLHAQPVDGNPVPFLFGGAFFSFFAFGASDAAARLFPALLGTGLVLVPLALRKRLGSWGALAATFLLAFSPTLVYYSRTLAGPMPALAGLGAVLVAVDLALAGRIRRAGALGAVGLGVALTSSPLVYTFLLVAGLFLGLGWLAERRDLSLPDWADRETPGRVLLRDRRTWGLVALAPALISTVLLLNVGGVQGALDLLASWLGGWVPGAAGRSWSYPLLIMVFYELAALVLGIGGLVVGLRRRNPWAGFLGLWALVTLALAMLSGGRDAAPVAFAAVPLALLSGLAVTEIRTHLRPAQWTWTAGGVAVLLLPLGFSWLNANPPFGRFYIPVLGPVLVAVTFLFTLAIIASLWMLVGKTEAAWTLAIIGFGLAACLTLRSSVSLNLAHGRDPHEPMVGAATTLELRDMVAFLEDWSVRRALDQHALPIVLEADLEPLVPWYLRDFVLRPVSTAPADIEGAAVITRGGEQPPALPPGYVGQTYRLQRTSERPFATPLQALEWWLVRTGGGEVQAETCQLWVKP